MKLGLKNKNILITGASKNIGRAIAISLAQKKSNVIICARNNKELEKVLKIMNKYPGYHHAFALDLENQRSFFLEILAHCALIKFLLLMDNLRAIFTHCYTKKT